MSYSKGRTKKGNTTNHRKKNHLSNRRRKDHFTKKRRKIKSKYNKRSFKRNRKTIKRNKRKYRGGRPLVKVKFKDYSFDVNVTVHPNHGFDLQNPNWIEDGRYMYSILSQVYSLLFKISSSRIKEPPYDFTLDLPTNIPESYNSVNPYESLREYIRSNEPRLVGEYTLNPEPDFLVNLCYCCSVGLESDWLIENRDILNKRRVILENILNRMNLTDHREQFKYASEILYYLMRISNNDLCVRLITRFKEILGGDFNTIAENRICLVWAHRTLDPRTFETIISPKCIIDERLLGLQKTDKLRELFSDIECNRCKVEVTSAKIEEGNKPFTQYTITLTNPDGSNDSFNFRWSKWRDNKLKVLDILKESRLDLKPVSYTDKGYFSTTWSKKGDDETVAKRVQMLTAIFNRQDLGEPELLDQTWFRLDRFSVSKETDPIGTFEKNVTQGDTDPYIKWLYDNIKKFFT